MNATASLRRLACLVTAVAALFPFAACRKPAASPGSGVKIGFLVKQPEEPWFQLEWKFADKASRDLGFELVKIGVPDGEKTLAAIDNLAAGGAQGFIICNALIVPRPRKKHG